MRRDSRSESLLGISEVVMEMLSGARWGSPLCAQELIEDGRRGRRGAVSTPTEINACVLLVLLDEKIVHERTFFSWVVSLVSDGPGDLAWRE